MNFWWSYFAAMATVTGSKQTLFWTLLSSLTAPLSKRKTTVPASQQQLSQGAISGYMNWTPLKSA